MTIEIGVEFCSAVLVFMNVFFWVGVACGKRWERQDKEISKLKDGES